MELSLLFESLKVLMLSTKTIEKSAIFHHLFWQLENTNNCTKVVQQK